MKHKYRISLIAIAAVTLIEIVALSNGVDGTMFGAAMAAIGAIVGYNFKKPPKNGE